MTHKFYTPSQITEILSHYGVLSCTPKYLCFTSEFKKQALDLYLHEYLSPQKVFEQLGLLSWIIDSTLPKNSLKDWKKRLNAD